MVDEQKQNLVLDDVKVDIKNKTVSAKGVTCPTPKSDCGLICWHILQCLGFTLAVILLFLAFTLSIPDLNEKFIALRSFFYQFYESKKPSSESARACTADAYLCELSAAGTVMQAVRSALVSVDGSRLQKCLDGRNETETDCPRDSESRLMFAFDNTTSTALVSYLQSGRTQVASQQPLRSNLMTAIMDWELDIGLARPDTLTTTVAKAWQTQLNLDPDKAYSGFRNTQALALWWKHGQIDLSVLAQVSEVPMSFTPPSGSCSMVNRTYDSSAYWYPDCGSNYIEGQPYSSLNLDTIMEGQRYDSKNTKNAFRRIIRASGTVQVGFVKGSNTKWNGPNILLKADGSVVKGHYVDGTLTEEDNTIQLPFINIEN